MIVIRTMTLVNVIVFVLIENYCFLVRQQVLELMNKIVVGSDVQIDERFYLFVTVIVFRDLNGDQRIDRDQTEVDTSTSDGAIIRIHVRIGTVRIDGISTASLLGQTE